MKKAGVVIDAWKLPIFKKHLDEAGYNYQQFNGPTKGVITLQVEYVFVKDVQPIIEAANSECAKEKHHHA